MQMLVKLWGFCVCNYKFVVIKKFKVGIIWVCVFCGEDGKCEKVWFDDFDVQVRFIFNYKLVVFIDDVQVGMVLDEVRELYCYVVEEFYLLY